MKLKKDQEVMLAALLHDVGKVLQRTGQTAESLGANDFDYQNVLPRRENHYTHLHALYTYLFLSRCYDQGQMPGFSEFAGKDENFIMLASRHHNPSSVYDRIVTEADWISSGMDRKQYEEVSKFFTSADHYIRERLSPVFEEISLNKHHFDGFSHRYFLRSFAPDCIFPEKSIAVLPENKENASTEYSVLWKKFEETFSTLQHHDRFSHYLEVLISLLEEHFWGVPSATYSAGKNTWSDISLYDHLITTAALSHVLLCYHEGTDTLEEKAIRDRVTEKFLFITIDISGIQKFIFDITVDTARGAAKMLRARSFYLNILMEGTFRLMCRELKLYSVNRLVDAGGRALILAPNLKAVTEKLETLQNRIDIFCLEQFQGELTLNLSWLPASGHDLEIDHFDKFLSRLNQQTQMAKLRKLSSLIGKKEMHLREGFWKEYNQEKGLCQVCGKRQATIAVEDRQNRYVCSTCHLMTSLGSRVASGNFLVYSEDMDEPKGSYPVPDGYFDILQNRPDESAWNHIWDISRQGISGYGKKTVANYIPHFHKGDPVNALLTDPRYNPNELCQDAIEGIRAGAPKTFHHIALSSLRKKMDGGDYQGKPYLAVFKADVDNLGLLFGYGLRSNNDQGNRLTIGRYATFSRMMDRFFTVYLPYLFESSSEFSDTYTIFAGGDDIFLIGPWTKTFKLASKIYEDFRRYTCRNPDITLSGTLNLMKSRHPVNYVAHIAEEGLDLAKQASPAKDSLHLWGHVLSWESFPYIVKMKDRLDQMMNDPKSRVSRGLIYDLMTLKEMKRRFEKGESLRYGAYASLFRYKLGRLAKEKVSPDVLQELAGIYSDYMGGDESLQIAIQWAVYLNRR